MPPKNGNKKGETKKITRGGTIGWTVKPQRGKYYNIVESLDDLICPPRPQLQYTEYKPPKEPPCCPASSCCNPPPGCPRQPGRRCC